MKMERLLRLGTRGSRLALAQASMVADLISRSTPGIRIETIPIKTAGDETRQPAGSETDRKFAFTHEIDRQLLEGEIDIGVHSMKDVPTSTDPRLVIAATPQRGDVRDALVTASGRTLKELPAGSAIGTGSIRRRVQLARLRRDVKVVGIRGNVETRIGKLEEKGLDGVVLAAAGLQRLGLGDRVSQYFEVDEIVPAACQGILAVTAIKDDHKVLEVVKTIDDIQTRHQSVCERAFLMRLGGDCNFPAGTYARAEGGSLKAIGMVANTDGSSLVVDTASGPEADAAELGAALAERLLKSKEEAA